MDGEEEKGELDVSRFYAVSLSISLEHRKLKHLIQYGGSKLPENQIRLLS